MSSQQLRMGKLAVKEFEVRHSSIQWLCADGHACRPNEIVAYCNITLEPTTAQRHQARPFNDEREFQVAFAPRTAGRLRPVQNQALHGYLDVLSVNLGMPRPCSRSSNRWTVQADSLSQIMTPSG